MLWKHWEESLKWRIVYLAETRKDDAAHTLLVRDIPGTPHGTPIGRLYDVRCPARSLCTSVCKLQCAAHKVCVITTLSTSRHTRSWYCCKLKGSIG